LAEVKRRGSVYAIIVIQFFPGKLPKLEVRLLPRL